MQWRGGQTIDRLPRGPFREGLWSLRIVLGATLALLHHSLLRDGMLARRVPALRRG